MSRWVSPGFPRCDLFISAGDRLAFMAPATLRTIASVFSLGFSRYFEMRRQFLRLYCSASSTACSSLPTRDFNCLFSVDSPLFSALMDSSLSSATASLISVLRSSYIPESKRFCMDGLMDSLIFCRSNSCNTDSDVGISSFSPSAAIVLTSEDSKSISPLIFFNSFSSGVNGDDSTRFVLELLSEFLSGVKKPWLESVIPRYNLLIIKVPLLVSRQYNSYISHVMRKPVLVIREQQKCRSACANAQSDQHLCCSLLR